MIKHTLRHNICAGNNGKFYGGVNIGEFAVIGNNVIIGYPKEKLIEELQKGNNKFTNFNIDNIKSKDTLIGDYCRIASNVVIYAGASIGNNVSIDDFCRIGFDSKIGNNTLVLYGAKICDRVCIGNNCKMAGFVCDGASIGNDTTMMGILLHKYREPEEWGLIESSPKIGERVVIGYDAKIIGGINIGNNSYIAAGAIVTKDVPPKTMVTGNNEFTSCKDWSGKMRKKSFWSWNGPSD